MPCDIRGHAEDDLTDDLYRSWGRSLGEQVEEGAKFVVGGDVRGSTPAFKAALIEGLCLAGADVVDLGVLPTPMVYYAEHRLDAAGCAVVTASHNPAEINGLKWSIGGRPPSEEDVRRLADQCASPGTDRPACVSGSPREVDISFDYVGRLQQEWLSDDQPQLRVVVDPMHGCWSRRARRYLQAIFPHAPISAIRDTPEGDFGGLRPDCSRPEELEQLSRAVDHERADLGIAFDGDGDRVAFVDDAAAILTAEEATSILLDSFGSELSGEPFVQDLRFSRHVAQKADKLGAETLVERCGHTFIRRRMLDSKALFGAETSGHYFFREIGGNDDGLVAACRLIGYLARSGKRLSRLRHACPDAYITPDLRVPVEREEQASVIEHVQAHWLDNPQILIDGVKVDFPDGWALVRSSVTEPALTFRFEAQDWRGLDKLVWRFCDSLNHVGDTLWARYEDAMGKRCPLG